MVETSPQALTTLFVVSVTVMVFFTTSASNRIEEMDSPNVKIIGTLTLVGSYCLLLLFGFIIISHNVLDGHPTLFAGLKIAFAAFIVPAFVLMYDLMDILFESYHDPEFSMFWTALGCGFVALLYLIALLISPTSA